MNNRTEHKGLSKDEVYLISRSQFEGKKLITGNFASRLFREPRKVNNILTNLKRKGWLLKIENGKYFIVPIKAPNQIWSMNEFITAKYWMGEAPYYIGYFTMYNYWGFTEQVPQTIYILNTKKSRKKIIANTKFEAIKITDEKYYGIEKIIIEDEEVNISDKERTLVDLINNYPGSFRNMKQILRNNIKKIDLGKFEKYLKKYPSRSVLKRAGYLMEICGVDNSIIQELKKNISDDKTLIVLNPEKRSRKGKINKDWKIIINE